MLALFQILLAPSADNGSGMAGGSTVTPAQHRLLVPAAANEKGECSVLATVGPVSLHHSCLDTSRYSTHRYSVYIQLSRYVK